MASAIDRLIVMFDPHVTSQTISPPRLSTEDKGKCIVGRPDLEMEIAQAIKGGEEAEIAYLVSLWSDQMDSDTVNTLQVTRKSQEDSSLSLESKSFGNSLVDLSCVCSRYRFVVLSPCLLMNSNRLG